MEVREARREVERATAILEHPRASTAFDLQRVGLELEHEPFRRAARRLGLRPAMEEIRDRTALALDALPDDDAFAEAARVHGALAAYALEDWASARRLLDAAGITADGDRPGGDLHAWCLLHAGDGAAADALAAGRTGFAWDWLRSRRAADAGREADAVAAVAGAVPRKAPGSGRMRLLEVFGWVGWVAMLAVALVASAGDPALRIVLIGILVLAAVPVVLTRSRRRGPVAGPCAARLPRSARVRRLPPALRERLEAWVAAG